ncbi:MAG: hypothetical protein U0794_04580 [Isosphaeraceae bacterium]
MALTPLVELGVDEVYQLLTRRLGITDLPPLEAIENEDWGRDLVLSRLLQFSAETLRSLGVTIDPCDESPTGRSSPDGQA